MSTGRLIRCAQCGTRVPSQVTSCPGCGAGLAAMVSKPARSPEARDPDRPGTDVALPEGVSRTVLVRDLLIFELKLFLDGLGDLVFSQIAIVAILWDLIWHLLRGGPLEGRSFYRVLRAGEKWDLWLNLYRPAKGAQHSGEGLLEAGAVDANSLLGKIESIVRDRQGEGPKGDRRKDA